jgi:hypothetical protein
LDDEFDSFLLSALMLSLCAAKNDRRNRRGQIGIQSAGAPATRRTARALRQTLWQGEFDPLDGVILHESKADTPMAAE